MNKEWFDKETGNWTFGLFLLIAFIGSKIAVCGLCFATLGLIIWDSLWFAAIIIASLVADLFENTESWTIHSFQIIEDQNVPKDERIRMIQTQLELACDRYLAVFLLVNGFDTIYKKLKASLSKITTGKITRKELIVILAYAIYNLFIRDLPFDLGAIDEILLFIILTALKMVDAQSGIAKLIAEMYNEAFSVVNQDKTLLKIRDQILALMGILHIEISTPT